MGVNVNKKIRHAIVIYLNRLKNEFLSENFFMYFVFDVKYEINDNSAHY